MRLVYKPIKFKIKKPTYGIPENAYRATGIFETRNVEQIAMLRRLPKDHAEEIVGEYEGMGWFELRELAQQRGIFKVGMSREAVIGALRG